jgi:parvulin-like peptidyl-prolyl isomerase
MEKGAEKIMIRVTSENRVREAAALKTIMAVIMVVLFFAPGFSYFAFAGDSQEKTDIRKEENNTAAAMVNGVVITKNSVTNQMKGMAANREQGEETEKLRKKALNSLILQELIWQKAQSEGLTVDQKTIDDNMEKIKTNLGVENGYRAFLEKEALTEEILRETLTRSLILERMFEREISDKIVLSEDEVKKEYEKEKEKFRKPEKVSVIDVVFFLNITDADSVKKVEEILKKINDDVEKNPMHLVPDGTFIVRELEVRKEEKGLYEEAKKLKEGEISGIIKTSDSFHLIKLKEYIPEKQRPLDEVRRSLEGRLRAEAQKKRIQEFESELKKGAKIEIIN